MKKIDYSYLIGSNFKNIYEEECVVVSAKDRKSIGIIFIGYKEIHTVSYGSLVQRKFKNHYKKTICGIGYVGIGEYKTKINKKHTKAYSVWRSMFERCYSKNSSDNYRNVAICEEWHNFQNYAKWHEKTYIDNYHLDKDLLQQDIENKIYSPDTCVWLPQNINNFMTNIKNTNSNGVIGMTLRGDSVCIKIKDLSCNKYLHKFFKINEKDKALLYYNEIRLKNSEILKQYMRDLGYWSEDVISKLK